MMKTPKPFSLFYETEWHLRRGERRTYSLLFPLNASLLGALPDDVLWVYGLTLPGTVSVT